MVLQEPDAASRIHSMDSFDSILEAGAGGTAVARTRYW